MELIKEAISLNQTIYSGSTIVTTSGDIIVPDIKPDILKILQVDAVATVSEKTICNGEISIIGKVNLTILYRPEIDEQCIESIKTSFDYSYKTDNKNIYEDMIFSIDCDVENVEFNLINSRKMSVKCYLELVMSVFGNKNLEFVTGLAGENSQYLSENVSVGCVVANEEHDFTVRDSIEVPAGKPSIMQILKIDTKILDKEIRLFGGKFVAKGSVMMVCLYLSKNGIEFIESEIPFTEVIDIDDINEDSICELDFFIKESSYQMREDMDGDVRILNFESTVVARIKATNTKNLEIISDFYCPSMKTDLIYNHVSYDEIIARPKMQQTLRDTVLIGSKAPQMLGVYNVITKACIEDTKIENGKILLEGRIEAYILYLSEDTQNPIYSHKKSIPFSYSLECENAKNTMDCYVRAEIVHTNYNLNVANEIELRCILQISAEVVEKRDLKLIADCKISEIPEKDRAGIIIYFPNNGEKMWNIAKKYSVSVEDILKYNNLDSEELPTGARLMIPCRQHA